MPTPLPLTIREAADSLEAHDLTSEQLTRVCLDRIAESQDRLNAFALVTEDLALEAALASINAVSTATLSVYSTESPSL